jgi:hypothetical protein
MGFLKTLHTVIMLAAMTPAVVTTTIRQDPAPGQAQLARADASFQQRSWQAAADDYRAIVGADPANGMAWFRLATSLEHLGRGEEGLAAYGRAAQLGFQPVRSELGSAHILATKGGANVAAAIEHLQRAIALGMPLPVLDADPGLAAIRTTPEFATLKTQMEAVRFPCRAVHTFDFWVGDFDVTPWDQPNSPAGGTLHNTREYEGCVIVERWTATGGVSRGMSMAFYDTTRHVWRMVWNDDGNGSNDLEGTYFDGAMRFDGWTLDAKGVKQLIRNVLENVSPTVIRQTFSTSSDNGKTWVVQSEGRFVRRKP